ncbi:hypothetical protein BH24DEI2_BH24DEI2_12350 [soil metagenome]
MFFDPPLPRRVAKRLCFSLLALFGWAAAQTFGVGLTTYKLEPDITVTGLDAGRSKVSLRVAGGVAGPLELGVSARETTAFGPIGNVTVRGAANFDSTGRFEVGLGAEGVIAAVAARAQLSLFTAEVGRFEVGAAFQEDSRPFLLAAPLNFGAALELGASYRVSRGFVANAAPALYLTDAGGVAGRVALEARLVKLVGPDDLRLKTLTFLGPSGEQFVAVGAEYDLNRRGWPNARVALWAGLDGAGLKPGASVRLGQTLKSWGSSYTLLLAAEPYRHDVLPYRAAATYRQNLGPGALETSFYGTLTPRGSVPALSFRLGYTLPF